MKKVSPNIQRIGDQSLSSPEYQRIPAIIANFGISRSHIFQLRADGTLESIHLKRPNATRGVRLIKVSSVRDYLNSFAKS
jgi:hypothetical protein